jgi:hypothetical protein
MYVLPSDININIYTYYFYIKLLIFREFFDIYKIQLA